MPPQAARAARAANAAVVELKYDGLFIAVFEIGSLDSNKALETQN